MHRLRQLGKPLGATFLGIAILVLIIGGRRYFESQVRVISFILGLGFAVNENGGQRGNLQQPQKILLESLEEFVGIGDCLLTKLTSMVQYWIIRGKFPASRGSIFLITLVAAVLTITSLVLVLTFSPTILERH